MRFVTLLLVCLICAPALGTEVLIGQLDSSFQKTSGVNAEGLVNADVSFCDTNPGLGGCSLQPVYRLGFTDGSQGTLEVLPSNPLFSTFDTKFHNPNEYVTITYTWGHDNSPHDPVSGPTVRHAPAVFKVSDLLSAKLGGTTGVDWSTTPHVPVGTTNYNGYAFDEFAFTVSDMTKEYFVPTSPGGALEPYLYWIKAANMRILGHTTGGPGDGVPEPSTWALLVVSGGLVVGYGRAFRRL